MAKWRDGYIQAKAVSDAEVLTLTLSKDLFAVWCALGEKFCLTSHSQIASFLIQSYQLKDSPEVSNVCSQCGGALSWRCSAACIGKQQEQQFQPKVEAMSWSFDWQDRQLENSESRDEPTILPQPERDEKKEGSKESRWRKLRQKREKAPLFKEKKEKNKLSKEDKNAAGRISEVPQRLGEHSDDQGVAHLSIEESRLSGRLRWGRKIKESKMSKERGIKTKIRKRKAERAKQKKVEKIIVAKGSHICDICGKVLATVSSLNKHKRIMHTSEFKPHMCDICSKAFRTMHKLRLHRMRHTGEKPHPCDVCGKAFDSRYHMKRHRLIHAGVKTHLCDTCGKKFLHKSALKQHRQLHTEQKKHLCDVCSKTFFRASNLKEHKLFHTGQKPHQCGTCLQNFTLVSHLKRHVSKVHMKEKVQQNLGSKAALGPETESRQLGTSKCLGPVVDPDSCISSASCMAAAADSFQRIARVPQDFAQAIGQPLNRVLGTSSVSVNYGVPSIMPVSVNHAAMGGTWVQNSTDFGYQTEPYQRPIGAYNAHTNSSLS